jgi:transcriptional regulator with XRE-family HTH domain
VAGLPPESEVPVFNPQALIRRALVEGDRQLRRDAIRFGDEFRELRLRTGIPQAAVARAIGVTRSVIARIEAGDPSVSPRIRARAAVVVGGDARVALYGGATPLLHDAPHARIGERLLVERHPRWRATVEAPVPGRDRRSSDVRFTSLPDVVLCEIESHVRRWEEVVRECNAKRQAVLEEMSRSGAVRVHSVLVLPPTRHHRALVEQLRGSVEAAFPVPTAALLEALRSADGPWPGDGILCIAGGIARPRRIATASPAENRLTDPDRPQPRNRWIDLHGRTPARS